MVTAVRGWVQASVCSLSTDCERLPPLLWGCVKLFHWGHCFWLAYRIRSLVGSFSGIGCAGVAVVLNTLFRERSWFRIVVHLLAVSERLQSAVQAYRDLCLECTAIKWALRGDFSRKIKREYNTKIFLSPAFTMRWQRRRAHWKQMAVRIAEHIPLAFKALLELSLRLYDTYHSFSRIVEGCPMADLGELCDAARFCQRIFNELELRRGLLQRVLQGVGVSFNIEPLLNWAAEQRRTLVSRLAAPAVAAVSTIAKRTFFDLLSMAGCHSLFPPILKPKSS